MKSFKDWLTEKMDPPIHVVERDGKFVVVSKDGEVVKTFDDKESAEKYAVANHDDLMDESIKLDEIGQGVQTHRGTDIPVKYSPTKGGTEADRRRLKGKVRKGTNIKDLVKRLSVRKYT